MVKKFQSDYATVEVSGLVTGYVERCRKCNEALTLIETGRQPDFDRTKDHGDRIAIFREVRTLADDLTIARVEANKRVAERQRTARRFIITVLLSILGILIALIFGFIRLSGGR